MDHFVENLKNSTNKRIRLLRAHEVSEKNKDFIKN